MRKWRVREALGSILLPQDRKLEPTPHGCLNSTNLSYLSKRRHSSKGKSKLPAVVIRCWHALGYLEGLFQHRLLSTISRVSGLVGWATARQFALLTSPQMMLMLVVPSPRVENPCPAAQWVTLQPSGKELELWVSVMLKSHLCFFQCVWP